MIIIQIERNMHEIKSTVSYCFLFGVGDIEDVKKIYSNMPFISFSVFSSCCEHEKGHIIITF